MTGMIGWMNNITIIRRYEIVDVLNCDEGYTDDIEWMNKQHKAGQS